MHGDPDKPPPTVAKVTGRLVADVAHALASLTILPSNVEPWTWLGANPPFPADNTLAASNGLIHLPSLIDRKDCFHPPTPLFFSSNVLDYAFEDAPKPVAWVEFLAKLWPNDPQSIATLQEWMGYLLTPDTRQQKILLFVGPKRSGKGTIARVIRELVGSENVAGPTLSSLGTNFGLWPLLGKSVAIISDARLGGRTDAATVTERLLSISGEDALTIDRKNLPPVTAKLVARFVIFTNELPKLGDASGALPGRMILLQLTRSWFGKEDIHLTDRLLAELPGILLWAVAGWERLHKCGRFTQPDTGREGPAWLQEPAERPRPRKQTCPRSQKAAAKGPPASAGNEPLCPNCQRPMDELRRCWHCHDRRCACGRMTGSAFISLCILCEREEPGG